LVDVSVRPLPHPQARLSTIVVPLEGLNQRPHISTRLRSAELLATTRQIRRSAARART